MTSALPPRALAWIEAGAILLLLLLGAGIEHQATGIGPRLIVISVLALAPLARCRSVIAGTVPAVSPVLSALSVLPLLGLFEAEPPLWAGALVVASTFIHAVRPTAPGQPGTPATLVARALVLVVAALTLTVDLARPRSPGIFEACLAMLVLDAWGRGSPKVMSSATANRLTACFSLTLGYAWFRGRSGSGPATLDYILAAAIFLATLLAACEVILVRGFVERPEVELAARRRLHLRATGLFVLSALGLLTAAEVLCHVLPTQYRQWSLRGHAAGSVFHVPGGAFVYEGLVLGPVEDERGNTFRWNAEGYHDADHDLAKPPGRARALVVGDSFVEAVQVPLEHTFHRRLEGLLARSTPAPLSAEVMAWGGSAWHKPEELEALQRAASYKPDLVLLEVLDGVDLMLEFPPSPARTMPLVSDEWTRAVQGEAIAGGLAFVPYVVSGRVRTAFSLGRTMGFGEEVFYRNTPPPIWSDAATRFEARLLQFREEARRQGALLAVFILPVRFETESLAHPETIPRGASWLRMARLEVEVCRRLEIPCIDLVSRFAARGGPDFERVHLPFDQHLSALGHLWAAEELAAALGETGLWPRLLETKRNEAQK